MIINYSHLYDLLLKIQLIIQLTQSINISYFYICFCLSVRFDQVTKISIRLSVDISQTLVHIKLYSFNFWSPSPPIPTTGNLLYWLNDPVFLFSTRPVVTVSCKSSRIFPTSMIMILLNSMTLPQPEISLTLKGVCLQNYQEQ